MSQTILECARNTFRIEAEAVLALADKVGEEFVQAVNLIKTCSSHTVISGMGKSGLIGRKISATLASTGTPSFFIHPAEAAHGDFGMLTKGDVLIAISASGETDEVLKLMPLVHRLKVPVIAMTGNPSSTLARAADIHLDVSVKQEACPLQLAPTASTTATLAMGDALAMALMEGNGFTPRDFAFRHPGGSLGRKLLTRVRDVMSTDRLPVVDPGMPLREVLSVMTKGMKGIGVVVENDAIQGVITDGDVRRAITVYNGSSLDRTARELMTPNPVTVSEDAMLTEAELLMQEHRIVTLLVVAGDHPEKLVGVVQRYGIEL